MPDRNSHSIEAALTALSEALRVPAANAWRELAAPLADLAPGNWCESLSPVHPN